MNLARSNIERAQRLSHNLAGLEALRRDIECMKGVPPSHAQVVMSPTGSDYATSINRVKDCCSSNFSGSLYLNLSWEEFLDDLACQIEWHQAELASLGVKL